MMAMLERGGAAPYPWQMELAERWQQRACSGQLPAAVLLTGAVSSGKTALATFWARCMLCEDDGARSTHNFSVNLSTSSALEDDLPVEPIYACGRSLGVGTATACGECAGCQLLASGNHPDFYRAETDSAQLTIDWARELNGFWQSTASRGGFKIALITRAERLNLAAANALLKTIEELPERCLAIFVTDQPGKLPVTLRSRCAPFRTPPVKGSVARDWVMAQLKRQGVAFDDDQARMLSMRMNLLLQLFSQSPLLVLQRMLDGQFWQEREDFFAQLTSLSVDSDFHEMAKQWLDKRERLALVQLGQGMISDLLKIKLGLSSQIANLDQATRLARLAERCSLPQLLELEKWLRATAADCQRININGELLIETLFCKWFQLFVG